MHISKRKREANRRNASWSTGPRTAAGKRWSRWNAVKHGLTAKTALLPGLESGKEFRRLVRGYIKAFEPKGTVEKSLVQQLAACDQQVQRGFRVERNEFKKAAAAARKSFLGNHGGLLGDDELAEQAKKRRRSASGCGSPRSLAPWERLARYQTTADHRYGRLLERLLKLQRLRKKSSAGRRAAHGK
jgi:hypothetical protein